jgi:hypothetical protein
MLGLTSHRARQSPDGAAPMAESAKKDGLLRIKRKPEI